MATTEEEVGDTGPVDDEVLVDGDQVLVPEDDPDNPRVDPDTLTTSKQLEEEAKEEEGQKPSGEEGASLDKLKSTLIISGVVVAVIGAILAIAKKIKEA